MPSFIILLLIFFCSSAIAQEQNPYNGKELYVEKNKEKYQQCMTLTFKEPQKAYKKATEWEKVSESREATHCKAVALISMKKYKNAAEILEKLASDKQVKEELVPVLLAQSSQAWVMGGNLDSAYKNQTKALEIKKDNVNLLIDRSIILALQKKYWESLDDLNIAIEKEPDRPEAYVFRASAWRHVKAYDIAKEDLKKALELTPNYTDALLERGLLFAETGEFEKAEKDWQYVIDKNKNTPAAEAARKNIKMLKEKK